MGEPFGDRTELGFRAGFDGVLACGAEHHFDLFLLHLHETQKFLVQQYIKRCLPFVVDGVDEIHDGGAS